MDLKARLEKDYIRAYKAKESVTVAALRMLKAAIKNREVEVRRDLDDAEVQDVISKQVKQRRESIEQYEAAGRAELAQGEAAELAILEAYMPAALTEAELADAVDAAVARVGAASMKDMGAVMQALAAAHKGRYDGRAASELVKQRLSNPS